MGLKNDMLAMAHRLAPAVYVRYILASGVALCADVGCFLALWTATVPASIAGAASYCVGIVVHWLISSRAVFGNRVAPGGLPRARQKAAFVASALAGLAVTTAILHVYEGAGSDPRLGKLVAVAVSFQITWLLRKIVVFGPSAVDA